MGRARSIISTWKSGRGRIASRSVSVCICLEVPVSGVDDLAEAPHGPVECLSTLVGRHPRPGLEGDTAEQRLAAGEVINLLSIRGRQLFDGLGGLAERAGGLLTSGRTPAGVFRPTSGTVPGGPGSPCVTAGLASASLCWIATRLAGRRQRLGRLAGRRQQRRRCCCGCPPGRSWNSVTAGLASASLCRIARACGTPPAPRPACRSPTAGADVVVAVGQVGLELGDGGVGVGQPLLDRQRLLVRRQRLGRLAGRRSAGRRCCCGWRPGRPGTG